MAKKNIEVTNHILVPKHSKLSEKEKEKILKQYNISSDQLPKIAFDDPAIAELDLDEGDVIKVERRSPTAGNIDFYRCVIK